MINKILFCVVLLITSPLWLLPAMIIGLMHIVSDVYAEIFGEEPEQEESYEHY